MSGNSSSKAFRPELIKGVTDAAQSERADIWTAMTGELSEDLGSSQEAKVKMNYKPRQNGKPVDMPELEEVPVMWPQAGGGALTFPMKKGDGVLLLFQSRNMDNWYEKGGPQEASTARMHDLSDAIALPGAVPKPKKLENYNPNHVELRSKNGSFKLAFDPENGKYKIQGSGGEELFTILKELLTILSGETTTVTYGSSAGVHPITHQGDYGGLLGRLNSIKLD